MADDKKSLHKGYVHYIPAVEERDDWDKDLTFVLIRSLDELRVHDVEHDYTAWDTETSGLDPDMDYLVGFSFSFDGETGYYVPVAHDDMALGTEAVEIFYSILKKTRKTQFLFNCRFDQRFLEAALKHKGWTLDGMPYYDVQNAIWLADTNVVMPSLKASERHFLGWKPKTFDETLGDAVTFQHVPAEDAYRYACTDAVSTYQLAIVSNKFYRENLPASRFDNNMLYPLMRLENTPQRLDTEYLKSLVPQVEAIIERTREEVYRLAGTQFNLNAPQQFGKILVERFGVDTGARTATGAMKADLKTIDAWMVKHNSVIGQDIKDFIKAYKEYKKTVKFKSSYLDKYIKTASEQDIYPVRFSYKTNSVPCLTENNTVLVKDKGFISIKDVTQDDMIWTAWGYRRVLWNKAHDVDKVFRVTLQNGMTIEGTDRHPVLVRKSPLESINPHGMTKDDVEWAGLCDLKTGEPVIINHTCAASSCDNGKICILARIMGYFYGKGRNIDGCLFTLRFARGKTSSYYRELLVSLFGEKNVSRYDVDSKCVEYSVTRHVLSQLLEQFGLISEIQSDSQGNKKVDNVSVYVRVAHARSVLHDTFRHFLCGYLDSKGTSVAAYNVKDIPENWVDGIHKDRVVFIIPSKERDLIVPMLWAASVGCDVTEHSFQAWFGECKLTRIDIHEPYALSNLKDLWSDFDPLTERFSSIRFPKQMRLYLESKVANVEVVGGETKVYDIEVEDVHEYVANGIVTHNTGRLSCFSPDALVHTRQGLVRIADITEEHDVEIAKDVYSKASLVRTGEQEFLRFVLSSGKSIECTSDHRFLCPSDTGYVWRFASEIQCGDSLCRTAVSFKGLQINFEMFLYGFFLGDGSYYVGHSGKIQRRRKESLRLFFNHGDYDAMMYIHNNLVERGVRHSMRELKDTLYVIEMSATACRIVSKWFPVANVPQKEREVDFSVIHSKADAFSVLCGFYQAEGEKHIRKSDGKMNSSLNITSYSLVCSLQKLADYVGIRTKIHRLKIDTEKNPTYSQQWRLQFCVKSFRKYLDDSIPFRINTKKSVPTFLTTALNSLAKEVWKVGERNKFKAMYHNKRYSLYSVMRLCEDSCLPVEVFDYEEVISIESCGKKEAYTLTVDHPLHRYIAEGVINHNCGTSAKNRFFTNNNVQSTPKPHAVMLKGRKATEQEIAEKRDILGWYFSNDIPDDDAKGLVEGMDPDNLNIRRAFLPENDQCYVVSIDMCLEGGSPVQTKRGYMGICEMKPGDEVWSPQGWVTVERIMRTGVKPMIKVYPDNGGQAIYCTENHPFILDGEQVKAKDIKGKVPRTELIEYSDDMNVFDGDSTPTSAYLLGFILCSGNILRYVKDENTSLLLVVWSEDEQHLRLIGKVLGGSYEIRHKVTEQSAWWVLHLSRNDVCERLLSLGILCGLTTSSDRVNFEWLGDNFRHFVRGMFDAIGSVKTDEGFTTELAGDASYMTEVQKRLEGQWKYIQKFRTYLRLQGTDEQEKFIYDYLYKDATLWVQQKRDVFDTWYMENFGEWEVPVWNCTVQTQEHQLYVQGMNVHQCAEELRIVANLYHEDTWIKAFNSGADVHKACYSPDTEFYVKSQGWMKAEQITSDMEIAYYDEKSDSFKFTRADKRATHKGKDVFVRSGVFNVTGNHRMYVSFDERGYHIERADNLRNCGNAKQRFQMKTAVGNRVDFKTALNEDTCESFILGFLSASDIKVVDKTLFVSYRPCFAFNYHAQAFIDKYCLVGCNALVVTDKGVAYLLEHDFDVTSGHVKDDALLFTSDAQHNGFVCGLLYGLSCRKDSTLGLGNGDDVHGRSYIQDKGLADWIQWHLTCSGYSCVVCHNIRSDRYALHMESRPNKDVGMTFHSVHEHSLTEGPVYSCFEVPGGLLVTRYDGRITVNGNTAVKLFGEENYTKDARKKAKAASFGILYGSGAQGFNQSFPDMTLDECREFMKKFKDALPAISQGQAENIAYARQYGDINTGFGRHRRVKFWLSSPDRAKQAFGERTTKNTAVQGTAADVLKIIFCRLWEKVFKPYPQVKFMSTIHDEVNFSIPIELAREVIPVCIKCMTIEREDWPVPLKCSLSISRTDLGSLVPFTYDADTDTYEPEWDTLEVKPKVTHTVEAKVVATEDESPSDDCVCGVSLDEIDF